MPAVATDWEETFRIWSKPSSETEQYKSDNAESMIRAAIRECPVLSNITAQL
jgi:ferredoxin